MEEFIEKYADKIFEGISETYPEYVPNDDTYLEDLPDDVVNDYIFKYMKPELQEFQFPITVDEKAKDILANQLKTSSIEYRRFQKKEISKAEFLDILYSNVDSFVANSSLDSIIEMLKKQAFYNFDPDKQLERITDEISAVCLVSPVILVRTDTDGYKHIIVDAKIQPRDEVVYTLPLEPTKLKHLLSLIEEKGYKSGGLNWLNSLSTAPSILIFGKTDEDINNLKKDLIQVYGLDR